jgi:hypothetical protein
MFSSKRLTPPELALYRQACTNRDLAVFAFQAILTTLGQQYKLEEGDQITFEGKIIKGPKKKAE